MKKTLSILLVIAVLFSLAACHRVPDNNNGNNSPADNSQTQKPTDGEKETTNATCKPNDEVNAENWGVSETWSAKTESTSHNYIINFPNYSGYTEGSGMVAEQLDGTIVIISGQNHRCPDISSVSEVFPAYFEQLEFTLSAFYGLLSDNFEFSVETSKTETINELNMHSFGGTIKFDYDGDKRNYPFVAYATQLEANGAYAYWVVYDVSDDQSNGQLIAEHALNMAKTFREEQ